MDCTLYKHYQKTRTDEFVVTPVGYANFVIFKRCTAQESTEVHFINSQLLCLKRHSFPSRGCYAFFYFEKLGIIDFNPAVH